VVKKKRIGQAGEGDDKVELEVVEQKDEAAQEEEEEVYFYHLPFDPRESHWFSFLFPFLSSSATPL